MYTCQTYVDWKSDPTITVVSTTSYPIKNIEFPAITICSQGLAKGIMEKVILQQFKRYLKTKKIITQSEPNSNQTGTEPKTFEMLSKEEVNVLTKTVAISIYYMKLNMPPCNDSNYITSDRQVLQGVS